MEHFAVVFKVSQLLFGSRLMIFSSESASHCKRVVLELGTAAPLGSTKQLGYHEAVEVPRRSCGILIW